MLVSGMKRKIVLEHQCCKPHVVRWNWSALLPQLPEQGGVVMRGLIVGIQDADPFLKKKTPENLFVFRRPPAMGESGSKFAHHYERQQYGLRLFEKRDGFRDAFTKVDVPIGVDGDPHFHMSLSIRS